MKRLCFALFLWVCGLLVLQPSLAAAAGQEVKLEGVPFQQVLDRLFGTTANPGLLDGNKRFELRAEDVILTGEQARSFFVPTPTNNEDIADLVSTAQQVRGALRIEGLLDGAPFEFKLAGREIKLEGLDLTQAQLDSLVEQLKGISGLREAKIESTVDGRPIEVKIENRAGRVKVEDREHQDKEARVRETDDERERRALSDNRGAESENSEKETRVEVSNRRDRVEIRNNRDSNIERREKIERPEKSEKIERPENIERVERPENIEHVERVERVERPENVERVERPETERDGTGRR